MVKSKKILITLASLVLFILLAAGAAYAEGNRTGIISGDGVNVRSTPDLSAKVVVQLSKDTKVKVTDAEGDWYKISCNDETGWVFKQFITVREEAIASGTVKGTDVNVRSKPDISSEILTKLDKGAKVSVFERTQGWYRISIGEDRYGWINKDFVTLADDTASRGLQDEVKTPEVPKADEEKKDEEPKDEESKEDADKVSEKRQEIIAYAKEFLGVRYVYGGSTPKGFDCSGFTSYVFKHFGFKLERSAAGQTSNGKKIKKSELKPGDLVFFDTNGGHNAIEHVGIYIGDGQFIHASSGRSKKKVVISDINAGFYQDMYMTARRIIED